MIAIQTSLRRFIAIALLGALAAMAIFVGIIGGLLVEINWSRHSEDVIAHAEEVRQLAVDMETGLRGFALTHDRRFLAPYQHGAARLKPRLDDLEKLVADNPEQRQRVRVIRADIAAWQKQSVVDMARPTLQGMMDRKAEMDRVRLDHDDFLAAESELAAEREARVRTTIIISVALTAALTMSLAVAILFAIRRELGLISNRYEAALVTAQDAVTARDRMLATVSHELRTPLTSILGWTTLLRSRSADDPDPQMTELALASIEQAGRLQARLVEDLIDVSRAAAGNLRIEPAPIDLRRVLDATSDLVRPIAEAKGIRYTLHSESEHFPIVGDATRLQQVFWNLINNAIRFTPRDGTVNVGAVRNGTNVIVTVKDTGEGIDPAFLGRMFQPFAQQNPAGTRVSGLGLGLAIARHIVQLHGGTIEAKSDGIGLGAELIVTLPAE